MIYEYPQWFLDFISAGSDRAQLIQQFLNANSLECSVMPIEGKNHLYVKFPKSQYNPMFRIKTVIAHYDRIGIGANDNSAAVFCLLQWAAMLSKMNGFHNIRLIFTDGEELGNLGVQEQGSYSLAQVFKRLGITNDDIFVFDSMGRGTVPVICKNKFPKGLSKSFIKKQEELESCAASILTNAAGHYFFLPAAYSDNAGFLVNGIPSVEITMLPSDEIERYLRDGQKPLTWTMFHTPQDNISNLDPLSFGVMTSILNVLASFKKIA